MLRSLVLFCSQRLAMEDFWAGDMILCVSVLKLEETGSKTADC